VAAAASRGTVSSADWEAEHHASRRAAHDRIPHVVQRFLGAEGGKGSGLALSKIFAPFGFYQELQLAAIERLPEEHEHEHEEVAGEASFEGEPV
jgi:hypothetical protein